MTFTLHWNIQTDSTVCNA